MQVQQLTSYPLLRVTKESTLEPYGFKGRESHSIPLVPAIANDLYPRQRVLLITPPPGLVTRWEAELLCCNSSCVAQGSRCRLLLHLGLGAAGAAGHALATSADSVSERHILNHLPCNHMMRVNSGTEASALHTSRAKHAVLPAMLWWAAFSPMIIVFAPDRGLHSGSST